VAGLQMGEAEVEPRRDLVPARTELPEDPQALVQAGVALGVPALEDPAVAEVVEDAGPRRARLGRHELQRLLVLCLRLVDEALGEQGVAARLFEEAWDYPVSWPRARPHHLSALRVVVCPYRVLTTQPTGLNTHNHAVCWGVG
jgi:hypothetical protein